MSSSVLGELVRFQPAVKSARLKTIERGLALVGRVDLPLRIGVRRQRERGHGEDGEQDESEAATHGPGW